MAFNLDIPIDRNHSNSFKWDYNLEQFGRADVLPFWVADMDFACAPPIIEALKNRMQHPIFGYSIRDEAYYNAVTEWLKKRHDWDVEQELLKFCPPGAIQAIYALITLLSDIGDEVIIQTPAYSPLIDVVVKNNRKIIENPLKYEKGKYAFDLDDLKVKITSKTKILLLCSPHNPTGRVWTFDELMELAEICYDHRITVISDEVHSDLIFKPNKHIPFGKLLNKYTENSVTIISPSKSFNTAALPQSSLIIPSSRIRDDFQNYLDTAQLNLDNIFAAVAMVASYQQCEDWLDDVTDYVEQNVQFTTEFLLKHLPKVKVIKPQGTYLLWLDFREFKMTPEEIMQLLIHKGQVALFEGKEFGQSGDGFFRMNLACSRQILGKGLEGMKKALI